MRSEFEKLPEVAELLSNKEKTFFYDDGLGVYGTNPVDDFDAGFINGAWYVFQEQQKKIDSIKNKLSDIYDLADETNICKVLDEIQELLK